MRLSTISMSFTICLLYAVTVVSGQTNVLDKFGFNRPDISVDPIISLPDLQTGTLARGLASPTVSNAINAAVGSLDQSFIQELDLTPANKEPVRAPNPAGLGPQFITDPESVEIGKIGLAMESAAADTARTLNVVPQLAASEFGRAKIQIDHIPRFPPQLLCPFDKKRWPSCTKEATSKYRTIDGSCNNIKNPLWGRAKTPFERFLPPMYDDGVKSPRTTGQTGPLPIARIVSTKFHRPVSRLAPTMSHFAMEYGQFISHDIQRNALSKGYGSSNIDCCNSNPTRFLDRAACFKIDIPLNDEYFSQFRRTCMNFVRALPTPNLDCVLGVREQLNQNTHFLDGSHVYGSDKKTLDSLRTKSGGRMKTSGILLPKDEPNNSGCRLSSDANKKCFLAGDVRVNQQPLLISLHTVFVHEHNRIAKELSVINPSWAGNDEKLFQEARRIVIAMMQHITYNEYLELILGAQKMNEYNLRPQSSGYFTGYNPNEKPMIRNGFSGAAFRFGHSMVRDTMQATAGTSTSHHYFKDVFLRPDLLYTKGADAILKGAITFKSEAVDRYLSSQLTRHLFEATAGTGMDLAATNVQRGRDHGLPSYQIYRSFCGLPHGFSHTADVIAKLKSVYGNHNIDDIDLFTGGVSETPVSGGKVGPTFACLLGKQFRSLKNGDRYYYENSGSQAFTSAQLAEIRKVTMAKIICRNTHITEIQRNVFKDVSGLFNPEVSCSSLPDIDLTKWRIGSGCIPVHGGWSSWSSTGCVNGFRIRFRRCNNPTPNSCGNKCPGSSFKIEFCHSIWPQPFPWDRRFDLDRVAVQPDVSVAIGSATPSLKSVEDAVSKLVTADNNVAFNEATLQKALASASAS